MTQPKFTYLVTVRFNSLNGITRRRNQDYVITSNKEQRVITLAETISEMHDYRVDRGKNKVHLNSKVRGEIVKLRHIYGTDIDLHKARNPNRIIHIKDNT